MQILNLHFSHYQGKLLQTESDIEGYGGYCLKAPCGGSIYKMNDYFLGLGFFLINLGFLCIGIFFKEIKLFLIGIKKSLKNGYLLITKETDVYISCVF